MGPACEDVEGDPPRGQSVTVSEQRCKSCGSPKLVRKGIRRGLRGDVQRWTCRDCGRGSCTDNPYRSRFSAALKEKAVRLVRSGVSLAVVKQILKDEDSFVVSETSIHRWAGGNLGPGRHPPVELAGHRRSLFESREIMRTLRLGWNEAESYAARLRRQSRQKLTKADGHWPRSS